MASRIKWALEKVAVSNEEGLTTSELMLTNDDLRPGKAAPSGDLTLAYYPLNGYGLQSPMPIPSLLFHSDARRSRDKPG